MGLNSSLMAVSRKFERLSLFVDTRFGKRPFRVHIDPTEDGANVGFTVLDRLRSEMLHRVGLSDVLTPRVLV
jgi:hypothetical protein